MFVKYWLTTSLLYELKYIMYYFCIYFLGYTFFFYLNKLLIEFSKLTKLLTNSTNFLVLITNFSRVSIIFPGIFL